MVAASDPGADTAPGSGAGSVQPGMASAEEAYGGLGYQTLERIQVTDVDNTRPETSTAITQTEITGR
jgi:hypothetical protein